MTEDGQTVVVQAMHACPVEFSILSMGTIFLRGPFWLDYGYRGNKINKIKLFLSISPLTLPPLSLSFLGGFGADAPFSFFLIIHPPARYQSLSGHVNCDGGSKSGLILSVDCTWE